MTPTNIIGSMRLSVTDKNNHTTSFEYDVQNRLSKVTDALLSVRNVSTMAYDPVGNLLTTKDREANITTYVYDEINRRSQMTDALGDLTKCD